jgi:1-acyl-sn-glycerol-3-phosphate acyltransferase
MLRGLIRLAFAVLARLEIAGRENLPSTGPLLVVANHFHFADPVAVIRALPWPLDFVGGLRLPNAPPSVRWLTSLWGTIRVHRGGNSRAALRAGEKVLAGGGILGIFPEGGSWAAVLRPARPGAAYLATRAGVLVVPVGLDGLTEIFTSLRRLRRARVTIRIGAPIGPFDPVEPGRAGRSELDRIGETIMRRIAALIPPGRRGVFSEDPNVRAAAAEAAVYPWDRARGEHPG